MIVAFPSQAHLLFILLVEKERDDCFTFIVSLLFVGACVLCLYLAVPLDLLWYKLAYPVFTHLAWFAMCKKRSFCLKKPMST